MEGYSAAARGAGVAPHGREKARMRYQRETLRHVITRALKRNTFTAPEPIEVEIK